MPSSATPAALGEPASGRKRRTWLLLPAVGLAVFLAACAAGWLYARLRIDAELDARVAALRQAGWNVDLQGRRWSGFPFRLKLVQAGARLITPAGWGVEAPGLAAEAVIFDPTHWVFAAPHGLVLHRGAAGVLQLQGRSLSASTAGMGGPVWRIAVVGEGLALAPAPGARPTAFTSVDRWEAYVRPAADGSGDAEGLWRLTGATPAPHGLVWRFSPGAPVEATVSGRMTRMAALRGAGWGAKLGAWRSAGGVFRIQGVEAHGGPTRLASPGGALSLDGAGRLVGVIPLEIRQDGPDGGGIEGARGDTRLLFRDGRAWLGGLRLGPAPEAAR